MVEKRWRAAVQCKNKISTLSELRQNEKQEVNNMIDTTCSILRLRRRDTMKALLSITLSAFFALAMISGCTTDGRNASKQRAEEFVVKDGKLLNASGKPMTGCVLMHNGKMFVMDGKLRPMTTNTTLADGTVCMVNGVCVMKGGSKRKLSEGEGLTPAGERFWAKWRSTPKWR